MDIEINLDPKDVLTASVKHLKQLAQAQQMANGLRQRGYVESALERTQNDQRGIVLRARIKELEACVSAYHHAGTPMELLLADIERGQASLALISQLRWGGIFEEADFGYDLWEQLTSIVTVRH